jgi:hypothetical protein
MQFLERVRFFLKLFIKQILSFHHGEPSGVNFILVDEIAKIYGEYLYDDKLDEFFPSKQNGPIRDKGDEHIPESNGYIDNVTVELLLVVNNHIPNICS